MKDISSKNISLLRQNSIRVHNLTKKFDKFVAVNCVSLDIKHGEIFAFLGPNGAGKTTTIKMLTTLLVPTSGSVLLNGKDIAGDPTCARSQFGIVFQDQSLDDELTARENLELHAVLYAVPKAARKERIRVLLQLVELWDRQHDVVKRFSGGMKRRLEIARALLHEPAILFLDEPTVGLDPQTRNHLWEYISNINKKKGITVFFTTHYMEEAEKTADNVAIIDAGKIIAIGSPNEIKKSTKTSSLEQAFLQITGHGMRDDEASSTDSMRLHARLWRR